MNKDLTQDRVAMRASREEDGEGMESSPSKKNMSELVDEWHWHVGFQLHFELSHHHHHRVHCYVRRLVKSQPHWLDYCCWDCYCLHMEVPRLRMTSSCVTKVRRRVCVYSNEMKIIIISAQQLVFFRAYHHRNCNKYQLNFEGICV